jgi:hypothetical protein
MRTQNLVATNIITNSAFNLTNNQDFQIAQLLSWTHGNAFREELMIILFYVTISS